MTQVSPSGDFRKSKFVAKPPVLPNGRPRIDRLLIANRGEIACRIISTCRTLDITSIAIYTDEDAHSLHVKTADEAVCLGSIQNRGGNPHLNGKLIIDVALSRKAGAIHPGYGYLAENAEFARKVQEAGIIFVGPSPYAISVLGDKRQAKDFLAREAAHVHLVPGYNGEVDDVATLETAAEEIGLPIMIKAAAGGGGRGLRTVHNMSSFREQLRSSQSEAESSFGSRDCILEKYIERGKHIEVQIVGDSSGNIISLGERECSVQRRFQKIIEEAPSSWLAGFPKVREKMKEAAIAIGKLLKYESAGTVEFLVDVETAEFYFLEVNTRIQVEHAITEETTGVDIVALQLFVAGGGLLENCRELSVVQHGHSIECRLCAEEPARDFMPGSGLILRWAPGTEFLDSREMDGIRIETAIQTGSTVSVYFDSMIAKIIVWAPNRASAVEKMLKLLRLTICEGVKTNLLFLQACLLHRSFRQVDYSTSLVQHHIDELLRNPYHEDMASWYQRFSFLPGLFARWIASSCEMRDYQPFGSIRSGFRNQVYDQSNRMVDVVLAKDSKPLSGGSATSANFCITWSVRRGQPEGTYFYREQLLQVPTIEKSDKEPKLDPGTELASNFNAAFIPVQNHPEITSNYHKVRIIESACHHHRALDPSGSQWLSASVTLEHADERLTFHLTTSPAFFSRDAGIPQQVFVQTQALGISLKYSRYTLLSYGESQRMQENEKSEGSRLYKSFMPCKVLRLLKAKGDKVIKGEAMLVVESMKTEVNIVASINGVFEPKVREGDAVGDGVLLCELADIDS